MPDQENTVSFFDAFLAYVNLLTNLIYLSLLGVLKALTPTGFLSRKSVRGEIVLITGAGSGLGRLLAIEFGKLGAHLVLWDINQAGNVETARLVTKLCAKVHSYTVDLSQRSAVQSTAERVKAEIGHPTILVNNAGIVTGKKFDECSDALIEKTMAVNTHALFWVTKAFLSHILNNDHGHIITIASMAGKTGTAGLVDYCASKFGAVGFAESLLAEVHALGKDGVHVTTICPYYIDTGMFEGVETYAPRLLPILEPSYVIDQIMEAILTNKEELILPRFCYWVVFAKSFLPTKAYLLVSDYFGVSKTMDHFVGRNKIK